MSREESIRYGYSIIKMIEIEILGNEQKRWSMWRLVVAGGQAQVRGLICGLASDCC